MSWLLIRGLSREQRHWGGFPDALSTALGEPAVSIDPPGFGTESERRSPRRLEAITDDMRARFIERRDDGPWSVLGISLGGMIALDWSARYPEDFDRSVVINTSTRHSKLHRRFRPGTVPAILAGRARGGDAAERATLAVSLNRADHDLDALARQYTAWADERTPATASVLGQIAAAIRFQTPASITVPTLVLTSTGDRLVSPNCSRRLATALDAPLAVHPDGGHDLALDDPDWIVDQILRWTSAD